MDQLNLNAWIGRADLQGDVVGETRARQIQTTLDAPGRSALCDGDPLPALWHWMAFTPLAPLAELGPDGHPGLGGFPPPLRLGRRMWAGGALRFHARLRVGEPLERRTVIRAIDEKQGGDMVLVSLDHRIFGTRGLAIEERQDIVYLPMPDRFTPPKKRPVPETAKLASSHATPETLLFRYSALTFNAHRIHYDLDYACEVEHYPGLVVHGPLQATWLMQAAVARKGRMPDEFHYRGVHPLFAGEDVSRCAPHRAATKV